MYIGVHNILSGAAARTGRLIKNIYKNMKRTMWQVDLSKRRTKSQNGEQSNYKL